MELSTSIPIPNANPDREIRFKVTPLKYISTIAASTLNGILNATTIVGLMERRKIASTMIARIAPTIRFDNTFCTIRSM